MVIARTLLARDCKVGAFPSPLVGEGGSRSEAMQTGEVIVSAE